MNNLKNLVRDLHLKALGLQSGDMAPTPATVRRVVDLCDRLMTFITNRIRFQTWPTEGLGIGLTAEEIDELLNEAESDLRVLNRTVPKPKKGKR